MTKQEKKIISDAEYKKKKLTSLIVTSGIFIAFWIISSLNPWLFIFAIFAILMIPFVFWNWYKYFDFLSKEKKRKKSDLEKEMQEQEEEYNKLIQDFVENGIPIKHNSTLEDLKELEYLLEKYKK